MNTTGAKGWISLGAITLMLVWVGLCTWFMVKISVALPIELQAAFRDGLWLAIFGTMLLRELKELNSEPHEVRASVRPNDNRALQGLWSIGDPKPRRQSVVGTIAFAGAFVFWAAMGWFELRNHPVVGSIALLAGFGAFSICAGPVVLIAHVIDVVRKRLNGMVPPYAEWLADRWS